MGRRPGTRCLTAFVLFRGGGTSSSRGTRRGSGKGAERAGSLEDALRLVDDAEQVFVIGGGQLYAAALPLADELLLTEIDLEVEGDTRFPAWDRGEFDETSREEHVSDAGVPFAFVTYVRKRRLNRGQAEA